MKTYSIQEQSILAFESVIGSYQEKLSSYRLISCMNYESNAGGMATHTGRSCVIGPSAPDFIADVEICARRSLCPLEHRYFNTFYQTSVVLITSRQDQLAEGNDRFLLEHIHSFPTWQQQWVVKRDTAVRTKLGARLILAGLFPLSIYDAPVDTSKVMVKGVPMNARQQIHNVLRLFETISIESRKAAA